MPGPMRPTQQRERERAPPQVMAGGSSLKTVTKSAPLSLTASQALSIRGAALAMAVARVALAWIAHRAAGSASLCLDPSKFGGAYPGPLCRNSFGSNPPSMRDHFGTLRNESNRASTRPTSCKCGGSRATLAHPLHMVCIRCFATSVPIVACQRYGDPYPRCETGHSLDMGRRHMVHGRLDRAL